MVYLAANRIVHRDSARNCLVAEDGTVRLADFWHDEAVQTAPRVMKSGDEAVPVKWMAPEAIRPGVHGEE